VKIIPGLEAEYEQYQKVNSRDPYSNRVVTYGEAWANLMEDAIGNGAKLSDVAEKASQEADTDGITGFMYGGAVAALRKFWVHGVELGKWHNRKYVKDEAAADKAAEEGKTVNPAVVTVNDGN
jgi:hypothetical protein